MTGWRYVRLIVAMVGMTFLLSAAPAQAQFDRLLGTIKDKAVEAIEQQGDTRQAADTDAAQPQTRRPRLNLDQGFDFIPGTNVVTTIDFADATVGAMPSSWKTNGSGQIVSSPDLPGKWLALQAFATYKLAAPPTPGDHFTVEFDLLPVGDTMRDVDGVIFGFAADNSVQGYTSDAYNDNAINAVELNFAGDSSIASGATGVSHFFDPQLEGYINRPMHISMAIDGDRMRVYVGHQKIGDARLFDGNRARYFFISAPVRYDHGAQALLGNLRIATAG